MVNDTGARVPGLPLPPGPWQTGRELGLLAGGALWELETSDGVGLEGRRWLALALPAGALDATARERAAALTTAGTGGEPHLAMPTCWWPSAEGDPATLALPAPGAWRVGALLAEQAGASAHPEVPELLSRLILAEALSGLAAAHRRGLWHGLLGPESLWLGGAPPARLVADCPRDPRVAVVGCGVLSLLVPAERERVVAAAPAAWSAPELRRGDTPGPAADLWAVGAVGKALVGDGSAELMAALAALQAPPELRPSAGEALERFRELALAGLATWRRSAPPLPRRAPALPLPRQAPRRPVRSVPERASTGSPAPPPRARAPWRLPVRPRPMPGTLRPLSAFGGRAAAGCSAATGLWLSLAPTAVAGVLSVLLALALLLAMR